ncbi:isoprenylcysteine carboxylmethyltransferase family protein [Priestia aryabhattai]|uniref:methyltransferase family protein n=1 Tax=Priestia aryabhattai TaxID=412384 RepID=UPI0028821A96|nr:isoprenylcysteine carboxylmethyltransferase family protein [Priestia aryabhattai]MDT0150164.1 isoprenylcysteine carboxylmethyltransferase family protein [Priestia aryabhattai]MDT0155766.1 isoprenylcysteine carboxylmethyltransferase family protein [Priestia aryabhattai]
MQEKFRIRMDILLALALPYIIGLVFNFVFFSKVNKDSFLFYLGSITVVIGLILENSTNFEKKKLKTSDTGVISGIIVSLTILLISLNSYYHLYFMFPDKYKLFSYLIGLVFFIFGLYLRTYAKKHLKGHFSHSLKIDDNHQLITTGVYQYVRHPAYLGTFLALLGTSFIFNSWINVLFIILLSPLGIKRIKNEEKMLLENFGENYKLYSKNVKKILPYIY